MVALAGLFVALVLALVVLHRELLRRAFLRAEDPRAMAALRIGFTLVAIVGVLEPVLERRWLFSDEGMLLSAGAREYMARDALAGYGEGGFEGVAGWWHYLGSGAATPLHFWDSPAVIDAWCAVLMLALVGLLVGWQTRVCGVLALVLYVGLLRRNEAFWGGEQVYCCGLFMLAAARCGYAYSVDNWLRCRRLRTRGLLSVVGGPGGGAGVAPGGAWPQGLEAIYRRIPAWPRLLVIAQVGLAYGANGLNKVGQTWIDNTALYYVMQGDWARFDARTLAVWLAPTGIGWMTWFVRTWESLFPLVVLGLVLRFAQREGLRAPRGARWLWLAVGAVGVWLAGEIAGEHPRLYGDVAMDWWVAGGIVVGLLWLGGSRLRAGLRVRGRVIRFDAMVAWTLGRRVWLTGAIGFTTGLMLLINVGMFPVATLMLCIAMVRGEEVAGWVPRVRGGAVIPCEDARLPQLHHDDARLPAWAWAGTAGCLWLGAAALTIGVPGWSWRVVVLVTGVGLLWVAMRAARAVREDMSLGPWAYGPLGRVLAGSLCAVQLTALAGYAVPNWDRLEELRREVVRPTAWWLRFTGMRQYWAMFSTVGRGTGSLMTTVIDAEGVEHDLQTDRHGPARWRALALWNWRQDKVDGYAMVTEGVVGLWHARALCRRFAREHAGATPQTVILGRRTAWIAAPGTEVPADPRERFDARAKASVVRQVECAMEPHGQWPEDMLGRLGLSAGAAFVPLADNEERWAKVRGRLGPLWPYEEWVGLLAIGGVLLWWRRRTGR
ncbi:MAG: hypothetical protein IPO88_11475 [Nannocystis sp.]|uniref:hypothetical protein n=1 Tax=Nannocystis sp. TaxID=1962667 RepID=UPI002429D5B9|nr:hypothetical protein [Nannocystis sp.]MBK9754106.1 hypothetical protein [Nannocystis sp.]